MSARPRTAASATTIRRSSANTRSAATVARPAACARAASMIVASSGVEAELDGEAHEAQHPQRIVAEGVGRRRTQAAGLQVADPAERVDRLTAGERLGDRVDGEVSPGQVGLQRAAAQRVDVDLPAPVAGHDAPGAELVGELEARRATGAAERARAAAATSPSSTRSRSSVRAPEHAVAGRPAHDPGPGAVEHLRARASRARQCHREPVAVVACAPRARSGRT